MRLIDIIKLWVADLELDHITVDAVSNNNYGFINLCGWSVILIQQDQIQILDGIKFGPRKIVYANDPEFFEKLYVNICDLTRQNVYQQFQR